MIYKNQPDVKKLFDLTGKVAIVTGGARDLGLQSAQALAEAGANVAITSRNIKSAEETARELAEYTGKKIVGYKLDVSDEESIKGFFISFCKDFKRLDILVNNAGINLPVDGGFTAVK